MFHYGDIRYAFRLLRRSPLFTVLTAVVLSGGLGLSIFTFSFLNTAMLKPLPLSSGEDVVRVQQTVSGSTGGLDAADLALVRPAVRTLRELGAYTTRDFVMGEGGQRRVLGATVTEWNMFEVTRTRPLHGRGLRPEDQLAGAQPVIVLGYRIWNIYFGSDPSIVNRIITLNGIRTRVVGVMPDGYGFPVASDAWVPLSEAVLAGREPEAPALELYARLANGVSIEQARTELSELHERARQNRPIANPRPAAPAQIVVRSFPMAQFGDEGPLFFATMNVLALLILLLACINVTNLLLARTNERAREVAVRLALGGSRARLIVQSMWESVLLCLIGGGGAVALAAWALGAINRWAQVNLQGNLAFWWVWRLDRTALVAAAIFVMAAIALLGGIVSARAAGIGFTAMLRDAGARSGRREGRFARALVVAQVATVSVLMFFGVMTGVVAYRVANVDVGYDTRNLLSAPIPPSETAERQAGFFQSIYHQLEDATVLESVLLRARLAEIDDDAGAFTLEGALAPELVSHSYVQATHGFLSTLGISMVDGRPFDQRDDERGVRVALVSQAWTEKHWPARSPVGERIRLRGLGETEARTIVGVVSNVLLGNPLSRKRSADAVYIPLYQADVTAATILFRHRGDAVAAQAALYDALAVTDPKLPPPSVATFDEILAKTTLLAKSVSRLFGLCFGFALLLAVSGTYGLMARSIGRRAREIGIRRALGATDSIVVRLLLRQGGRQLGIGVLLALPVMALVGIGFWRFFPIGLGVSLGSGLLVAATIVGVVLAATYLPTRRVLRITARDALWRD